MSKIYLFLMMSGKGNRFKNKLPKQYTLVDNNPIFIHILNDLLCLDEIDSIICITNPDYYDYTNKAIDDSCIQKNKVSVTVGGSSRNESIINGMNYVDKIIKDDDIVLIYDVTHPFVDMEGIIEVIKAVSECGMATLAEYQHDTVYEMDPKTNNIVGVIPRERVVVGASPEGFTYKILKEIYLNKSDEELEKITCAGAMAINNNMIVKAIKTKKINLKITYKDDFDNYLKFKR